MANGHGGKRQGGGRKPKISEIQVIEQMDAIAVPERAWRALWARCEEGDVQSLKTWIAYRFGNPKNSLDVTTKGDKITPPINWISPEE
jgi:hypothetical protein